MLGAYYLLACLFHFVSPIPAKGTCELPRGLLCAPTPLAETDPLPGHADHVPMMANDGQGVSIGFGFGCGNSCGSPFKVLCLARMVDEIMADLAQQTFRGQIEAMQSS